MLGEMCRGSNWDYSSELREEEARNRNLKAIRVDTTVWKHENRGKITGQKRQSK